MQDAETSNFLRSYFFSFFYSVYGQIVMESLTLNFNDIEDRGGSGFRI